MAHASAARQCHGCLGWGPLNHPRLCYGCRNWEQRHRVSGTCRRCRHQARVNRDTMCRPCLLAIRIEQDADWVLHPGTARPRDRQLELIIGRHDTKAIPLTRGTRRGGYRDDQQWKQILKQHDAAEAGDRVVLPPAITGQMALFDQPRVLSRDTLRRLGERELRGYDLAAAQAEIFAADYGFAKSWVYAARELLRLALAVRDADGRELVPEHALDDLPCAASAMAQILDREGMLGPREVARSSQRPRPRKSRYLPDPPRVRPGPHACPDCDGWLSGGRRLCRPCQHWRSAGYPAATCTRCRRPQLPLRDGLCRGCHWHVRTHGPAAADEAFTQLWISIPRDRDDPEPRFSPPPSQPPIAAPTAMHGQQALFQARRDWSPVLQLARRGAALPALTATSRQLTEDFARHRREKLQDPDYRKDSRTLTILVSWLGVDNPIPEADVHDLASMDPNLAAVRVCQFLKARGLLIEEASLHQDPHFTWTENTLAALPAQIATELRAWVTVMRGHGRRAHPARDYAVIRSYLNRMLPAALEWSALGISSLREVTLQQVSETVSASHGSARKSLAVALRSLFRALRQERVIFQNPARNLVIPDPQRLPQPVPSDVLAGLLQQARTEFGRLVIALTAVHALPGHEICALRTADADLSAGRLIIRREFRSHTVFLEELTHTLASQWLIYRHRRWPASANPHLLVTQRTALDPDDPPVSVGSLRLALPAGTTLQQLRQDRILDEAASTADPLHLIRLFGITEATAMRYVVAAHPERTAELPAQGLRGRRRGRTL